LRITEISPELNQNEKQNLESQLKKINAFDLFEFSDSFYTESEGQECALV
jgi:hypothetical protein